MLLFVDDITSKLLILLLIDIIDKLSGSSTLLFSDSNKFKNPPMLSFFLSKSLILSELTFVKRFTLLLCELIFKNGVFLLLSKIEANDFFFILATFLSLFLSELTTFSFIESHS